MTILLVENVPSEVRLNPEQVEALQSAIPGLIVQPRPGRPSHYQLTAGQFVGRIDVAEMSVEIRPKILMRSMLFMIVYSIDPKQWRALSAAFIEQHGPLDAIAFAFAQELSRTLSRGVLRGYMHQHEPLSTVRGRIRVPDQLRRWYGRVPPVECSYDEFTEDILENRLIKAALRILRRLSIRTDRVRHELARAETEMQGVSDVTFERRTLPELTYTRLNERYRCAVEIAKLVIQATTIESGAGRVRAAGILIDMAKVFEAFVLIALREARLMWPWRVDAIKPTYTLDVGGRFRLIPDLAFRHQGHLVAVGDLKYKRTPSAGANHPDLYQVLSYCVAFDTEDAVLIYPLDEADHETGSHEIRHLTKRIHVVKVDLNKPPYEILQSIERAAVQIRQRVGAVAS